ncbi:hypothetical protein PVK06_035623 [Gossypium arboreum]|uniref:Zinc finger Sec23/Sec24-type domain-containing protein n=1 Tax=Gossypium arboreum TaxID=29729 RepID=A0ABR0NHB1_GOSAR|nr:hypothetical protein PVK06_035623 [Gossypium arboreum]
MKVLTSHELKKSKTKPIKHLKVVDFGESGPVRCSRCKGYINPFMKFIDQERKFICNLCDDPQELEKYSDDNKELAWMFFIDGCTILQDVYMPYGNDDDVWGGIEQRLQNYDFELSLCLLLDCTDNNLSGNLMHWLSQTFSPAKGNYKGTSSSRSGGSSSRSGGKGISGQYCESIIDVN